MAHLTDLLASRALHQPEQTALVFLQDGERESQRLSYARLDQRARAIAAELQMRGFSGQRALLLYPGGLDFVTSFLGCLYAGVVAVPAYPPRPNRFDKRILAIATDAQASLILATREVLSSLERRADDIQRLKDLCWLATDNIADDLAEAWRAPQLGSDTLAFLQYTSGSTGAPKGVMISHGNLLHNEQMIEIALEHSNKTVFVGWLPLFHDMGLIGNVLQPLYLGIPCILMSPAAFLQKPLRWLQAISQYRATTSGGPNFAYGLCVQKITAEERSTLDLSSWDLAFNGAEPVRADTLERFARTFESCGFRREAFYPCYGMAETTLFVSGGAKRTPPVVHHFEGAALEQDRVVASAGAQAGSRALVGCGRTWLDQKVVIADPVSLTRCPPDGIGEIWVSGPSVAQGYWNRPAETEQTFHAYLADTREEPFLRTGDLGFLQDGELFVTGRLKDLIIMHGQNHYPQDIELTMERCHLALRAGGGAAFSVEDGGEEQLVVAHEVKRDYLRKLNVSEVIGAIRQAVSEQHDLRVSGVLLLKPGGIPKTSSGKIQRHACRAGFLAGTLKAVGEWRWSVTDKESCSFLEQDKTNERSVPQRRPQTADTIQAWLVNAISQQLEVAPQAIDSREPFARYGLDSIAAVSLSGELEAWLGRRLSPTLVYDYPTIETLAQYLAEEPGSKGTVSHHYADRGTETEAIAIIGIGCRFPGANNLDAFWQLLREGVDAISEVPPSRWDVGAFYDPTSTTPGKINTRWGGFLEGIDQFDPQFFGISPREAESMDPQQRLLLEVSWEALENAGQAPDRLAGSQTGVFIGISTNDYSRLEFAHPAKLNAYSGTGNAFSIAANRLSYLLDFRGPSWAVDTACSSSLVAVHQACQSLRQRECDLATAGGVNLILSPALTITFSQAQMMAGDGRCKTFDADADGYVRGEGCGIVVLKRLSDATRAGDNILALIRGSAVNQDGRSNGLTAPNGPSQQAVIRQALKSAGVEPMQISYVETHGSGTPLGDPIELNSLREVLTPGRTSEQPCWLGSVKTNFGHLEAAAGIAGLIKVVLALQQREIPPHLHLKTLNPHISIGDTPLSIPTECQPWPAGQERRLAGVSSFGFGGTNAHLVLEESSPAARIGSDLERPMHLLALSAKSQQALKALAQAYDGYLQSHPGTSLADMCFTANTGRTHFSERLVITTESTAQLREQLTAFSAGRKTAALLSGQAGDRINPKIAFLFTGQGSQHVGMGHQLYETQPRFRETLNRCDEILRPCMGEPLLEVLYSGPRSDSDLNETVYTQPAMFALGYALADLWRSWGIEPGAVMGHSVGEYVAACVAGVFGLEEGLKLIAERGGLMQELPKEGTMVAVFADEARVSAAIEPYTREVSLAGINGPESVVISGKYEAVRAVTTALEAEGLKTRKLKVSHAFHSPLMEPMLDAFERVAREISYSSPRIDIISNVTGKWIKKEITKPEYWCRHVRQPVRFADGMKVLHEQGYEIFIEIGPKPALLGMGRQCVPSGKGVWLASLREGQSDWHQLLQSVGELYVRGMPVDWPGFDRDYSRRRIALPTYPWQRSRYWVENTENESPKVGTLSEKSAQSSIVNRLNQEDIGQLIQQLDKKGNFSEEQKRLLPQLLEVLVEQHQQERTTAAIGDWFYQLEWQPKHRGVESALAVMQAYKPGTWLIFADRGGVGQALSELLETRGQNCVLVYAGEVYKTEETGVHSINPVVLTDIERLFQDLLGNPALPPLKGIVHLWSLEVPSPETLTVPALERAQIWGCGSVVHLVQTLVKRSVAPRLWLVTRGAVPAGQRPSLAVAQAPLWGLGKVIALEHPQLWGGMVDLAPDSVSPEAVSDETARLLEEIWDSQGENQLALRDEQRYVARLVRSKQPKAQEVRLQSDATYLITGGLGALGLRIARWMVEQGARHLVLTGRRGAPIQAKEALHKLEQVGAQVLVAKADVSNQEDMVRVFEQINASWPLLRGIVHAAGVLDDGMLLQQNRERLTRVMAPKVSGAWNLHLLTQNLSLDFLVLFSSASSLLGSPGQGNYAAANAFLDALAHHRWALGQSGLSLNWGQWAEGGMAASLGSRHQSRFIAQGFSPIAPEQGLQILQQVLGQDCAQVGVLPIDWSVFSQQLPAGVPLVLLSELVPNQGSQEEAKQASEQQHGLLQRLKETTASDRKEMLMAYIQEQAIKILGLDPSFRLDPKQSLNELGFDSLMSTELKNRFMSELKVDVPIKEFIGGVSIAQLVGLLLDHLTLSSLVLSEPPSTDMSGYMEEITV